MTDRLSLAASSHREQRMAAELLDGKLTPGVNHLNSDAGIGGAIQQRETESPPGLEGALPAEAMIGLAFAEAGREGGPETILLVEDEAFVRTVTAEVLESAGYRLLIAGSAAEALETYRRDAAPVDLLLADVVMPGMNGRELAAAFESLCPQVRVLLMSGYPEQLALSELATYDQKYLAKPFSMPMLLSRVREVLDTRPVDLRPQA